MNLSEFHAENQASAQAAAGYDLSDWGRTDGRTLQTRQRAV